jgi:2-polyprenyl-3-methyl-5-hydroxy-6-metoxy-1,4-benzoquinol methylase
LQKIFFNEKYAYFSSVSRTWLQHAQKYSQKITKTLGLNSERFVVEVASNDGYFLQFIKENGIPCLGVEPTKSTADICEEKGIRVERKFFGEHVSEEIVIKYRKADLVVCNNVYAHVPDIKDFTKGIKRLITENGVVTIEFPHFMELLLNIQFDTIYHEHFSYLSLHVVKNYLKVVD